MIDLALMVMALAVVAGLTLAFFGPREKPDKAPATSVKKKWILLDGSNVLYWENDTPKLKTLLDVTNHLKKNGYAPVVILDANAGYLIGDKYLHHDDFARLLKLPVDRVMVVSKGEPADPAILLNARDLKARVVTNDRYRDWAGEFPEVRQKGFLVRGGYKGGRLEIGL